MSDRTHTRSSLRLAVPALLATGALAAAAGAVPDSLTVTVERAGYYVNESFGVYEPYSALWIENAQGSVVKVLRVTLYDDNAGTTACGKLGYLTSLTHYYTNVGCPPAAGPQVPAGGCPAYEQPPDGITACSEHVAAPPSTTSLTRTWDLTDLSGARVPPGAYTICYNSVIYDQRFDPTDKLWKLTLTLGALPFDTVVTAPLPQPLQRTVDATEDALVRIEVHYGEGGSAPAGSRLPAALNVAPAAPSAAAPEEPDFCGSGAASAAGLCLIILPLVPRRRRRDA